MAWAVEGEEEKARLFYGGILGLREIPKPAILASRGGIWFQLIDGHQLHLGVEDPFRPSAKAHPGFVADDLHALAERLSKAGYAVKYDQANPPIDRFYTNDVFGNRLEFADRPTPTFQ